jgi:hypothetical protein
MANLRSRKSHLGGGDGGLTAAAAEAAVGTAAGMAMSSPPPKRKRTPLEAKSWNSLSSFLLALYHYRGIVEEGIAYPPCRQNRFNPFENPLLTAVDNRVLAGEKSSWSREIALVGGAP